MNSGTVSTQLTKELGVPISKIRVQRYCDSLGITRSDNNYRTIKKKDYLAIKLFTVLAELNIPQDDIVNFITHDITPQSFALMYAKVNATKDKIIPIAETALSEYAFKQL